MASPATLPSISHGSPAPSPTLSAATDDDASPAATGKRLSLLRGAFAKDATGNTGPSNDDGGGSARLDFGQEGGRYQRGTEEVGR